MKLLLAFVSMVSGLAAVNSATAAVVGDAANYNVFIFGTGTFISENTDTMGNLAVGGDVSLMNYSVAAGIPGNASQTPNPARLVVGGSLTAQNGGVGSNQQGNIYTNGTTSLTSFTSAGVKPQTLISSFAADITQYTSLSSSLSILAVNGTTSSSAGNTLNFTGTSTGLNVFTVSGSLLASSQTINISAPTGSTVLINVSGTSTTFDNGGVSETGVGAASVFYNLYQATNVSLPGGKDPEGSILAPLAGVTGGSGQMHGQLIAGSYQGDTQFDSVQFTGNLTPVPLPASVWLLVSVLGVLVCLTRRRNSVGSWFDFPSAAVSPRAI